MRLGSTSNNESFTISNSDEIMDSSTGPELLTTYSGLMQTGEPEQLSELNMSHRVYRKINRKRKVECDCESLQSRVAKLEQSLTSCQISLNESMEVNNLAKRSIEDLMASDVFPKDEENDKSFSTSLSSDLEMKMLLSKLSSAVMNLSQELKEIRRSQQSRNRENLFLHSEVNTLRRTNENLEQQLKNEKREIRNLEQRLLKLQTKQAKMVARFHF